jgi:hypothetical protein
LELLRWSRLIIGWVVSLWVQDAVCCRQIINNRSSHLALLLLLHPHFILLNRSVSMFVCMPVFRIRMDGHVCIGQQSMDTLAC